MQMFPVRPMSSGLTRLMPGTDGEIVSSAVRLLRQGRTMLPKPRFRFLSVPEIGWGEGGELLGTCAARLDAPDNSILLVSLVEDERDSVTLPPADGMIVVPNNPSGVSVDGGLVRIIESILSMVEISPDVFGSSPWPYPLIPLVVEASRTRRRGTPVCTPMVVRGASASMLDLLVPTLFGIGTDLKVGVLITRSNLSSTGPAWELFERIVARLPIGIELILGTGGMAYGGSARREKR